MKPNCRDCSTREEELYWNQLKTVRFFQTLSGNFRHQLELPQRFVKKLSEKLQRKVYLKAPSGATWEVALEVIRNSLYFKLGWKKFIEDNCLEENDALVFMYNGNSNFDVFIFNESTLEKVASRFVRNCSHIVEQVEESASEDDSSMEKIPLNRSKKVGSARRCDSEDMRIHKKKRKQRAIAEHRANAKDRAKAEASDQSLQIVMKDSNIHRRSPQLSLPARWSNNHLPHENQNMKLQLEGKVWEVMFYKRKKSGGGVLGGAGWKKFVSDNALEEDDACLFNLVSAESSRIVIDVKIFRVAEEVAAPMGLKSKRKLC